MADLAIPVGLTTNFIALIEKSVQIYRTVSAAKNFGSSAAQSVMMLRFEAYRYLIWVQEHSPVSATSSDHQLAPAIPFVTEAVRASPVVTFRTALYDAIAQVFEILQQVDKLLSKYDRAFESTKQPEVTVFSGLSTSLASITEQSNEAARAVNQFQDLKDRLQSKTPLKNRIKYGIRTWNDADKDILKELIGRFKYWNDSLHELVPLQRRNLLEARLSSEVVGTAQSLEDLNRIQAAADASAYPSLSRSAGLKRHNLLEHPIRDPKLNLKRLYSDIEIGGNLLRSNRFITWYTNSERGLNSNFIPPERVIIEWYYYDEKWTQAQIAFADERVEKLAYDFSMKDKPQSLRVLDCIGYICHPKKADRALIYAVPSTVPLPVSLDQPVSLFQLLSPIPTAGSHKQRPSLSDRFHLALLLATSFLELHNVGWLHKYFNSHNVLFFTDTERRVVLYAEPYIAGFDFSRQDKAGQISLPMRKSPLDLYRHPKLRQAASDPKVISSFTRKHDIYSLGLVLFEIGMWRRLEDFSKPNMGAELFRGRILEHLQGDMALRMGNVYQRVVEKCISGEYLDNLPSAISLDFGGEDGMDMGTDSGVVTNGSASQLTSFYHNIVSELRRCQCGAS